MLSVKQLPGLVLIVLVSVLIVWSISSSHVLESMDTKLHDHMQSDLVPYQNIKLIVIDDKSIEELGPQPWNRLKYIRLLEKLNGARVIAFDMPFSDDRGTLDLGFARKIKESDNVVFGVQYAYLQKMNTNYRGKYPLLPSELLRNATKRLGYVNSIADSDGITRRIHFDIQGEDNYYPHLVESVYEEYSGEDYLFPSTFPIRFYGPPGTFEAYSFADVYSGRIPPAAFDGSIVFVGYPVGEYIVPTSNGETMSRLEFHAHALGAIFEEHYLLPADRKFTRQLIPIAGFALCVLIFFVPFYIWIPAMLAGIYLYYLYVKYAFEQGIVLNVIYVPLTLFLISIASILYLLLTESKRRNLIADAFGKYLSPIVIKELLKNEESVRLGGEKKLLTVMFCDIKGFTTHSEKIAPEQLVQLLNEYMTLMTRIIHKHKGLVDKFIGDAIMAFWGAPVEEKNHAKLAAMTALEMRLKILDLQKLWKERNLPSFDIRIGINTGEVIVGNMGSHERFDYTVIGDNVNLASRLEGLNKEYGTTILITEETRKMLDDRFLVRKLDQVVVKGKSKHVWVYELICLDPSVQQKETVKMFERAMVHYFDGRFTEAKKEFEAFSKKYEDHVAEHFVKRCEHYIKHPPAHWTGINNVN